jgi:anti-anti-sigma factor
VTEPARSPSDTVDLPAGSAQVVLRGELDIATLDDARRQIEAVEAGAPPVLVLDLSGLTFVDSSGVRLALLADDRARAAGRRLAVRLGTGQALRVFQALGLLDKLDVLPAERPSADHRAP